MRSPPLQSRFFADIRIQAFRISDRIDGITIGLRLRAAHARTRTHTHTETISITHTHRLETLLVCHRCFDGASLCFSGGAGPLQPWLASGVCSRTAATRVGIDFKTCPAHRTCSADGWPGRLCCFGAQGPRSVGGGAGERRGSGVSFLLAFLFVDVFNRGKH